MTFINDDQMFRYILLIGFACVLPAATYFRVKSQARMESLDRKQEGWIMIPLRLMGVGAILGTLAFAINPLWMYWSSVALPTWLRWVGVVFGIPGAFVLLWTFRTLGPNLTDTVVTRQEHHLITHGPYRWVRHPFYVSFMLAVIANALVTANAFVALCGALAFLLIYLRTSVEERNLEERFGDEYRFYTRRTGRFFPRVA